MARCPPVEPRSITCLNDINCGKDENLPCTVLRKKSESPCFPRSYIISAELRSECVSSAQKPKFNCLLTRVYSGQRERHWECMQCVLREGCVRKHATHNSNSRYCALQHACNMVEAQINIGFALLMLLTKYKSAQYVRSIMWHSCLAARLFSVVIICILDFLLYIHHH